MSVRAVNKIFAILLIFPALTYGFEKSPVAGTYTSLTYNEEGGDLLGYEFRLIPNKNGYKAVIQVSEGGIGNVFLVDVTNSNEKISFDVPVSENQIGHFKGSVNEKNMTGTVSYPSGAVEKIILVRGASYWEKVPQTKKCQ